MKVGFILRLRDARGVGDSTWNGLMQYTGPVKIVFQHSYMVRFATNKPPENN